MVARTRFRKRGGRDGGKKVRKRVLKRDEVTLYGVGGPSSGQSTISSRLGWACCLEGNDDGSNWNDE